MEIMQDPVQNRISNNIIIKNFGYVRKLSDK